MTTSLRDAVRRACADSRGHCEWPKCQCLHMEEVATRVLTALIDQARVEERAECAKVADQRSDTISNHWAKAKRGSAAFYDLTAKMSEARYLAAAIRTRATGDGG